MADLALIQTEITSLLDLLKSADRAYHDAASPVICSDDEYDAMRDRLESLTEQLISINPADPLIPASRKYMEDVGSPALVGTWAKREHPIAMSSLNKVKGLEGIKSWFDRIASY